MNEQEEISHPQELDWHLSVTLAEASQIAYLNESEIITWATAKLGSTNVEFIDAEETEVFIAENDSEMYIVFRGSKGFRDWIATVSYTHLTLPTILLV